MAIFTLRIREDEQDGRITSLHVLWKVTRARPPR
jgi:hypothetical protein